MKPPGAPRQPLGEVSPNQRSRVVGAYDHGIKVPAIARRERLTDSTCRSIIQNASHQVSCITPTRKGAPSVLTPGDHRLIRRVSSKSQDYCPTAFRPVRASLLQEDNLPVPSKSGIQKWRAKQLPPRCHDHRCFQLQLFSGPYRREHSAQIPA
jgi:hypothetical protein